MQKGLLLFQDILIESLERASVYIHGLYIQRWCFVYLTQSLPMCITNTSLDSRINTIRLRSISYLLRRLIMTFCFSMHLAGFPVKYVDIAADKYM